MTLEELYNAVNGDYSEALGRLYSEDLVGRFIVKLLDDDTCEKLVAAWAAGDEKAAFEAAHTAKGVLANLSLTGLANKASEITEALRPGNDDLRGRVDVGALVSEFDASYQAAAEQIAAYAAQA